jgi:hypothetical protein
VKALRASDTCSFTLLSICDSLGGTTMNCLLVFEVEQAPSNKLTQSKGRRCFAGIIDISFLISQC